MIELTKVQLQESLNNLLEQESGLTTVLEMTLNSLMYCEREHYLNESNSNKGNGYRKAFAVGNGQTNSASNSKRQAWNVSNLWF